MEDEVDLLNANDIVSISVNENRLKQVFVKMMTKLNQHATKIMKLQSYFKQFQQSTDKSIYTVQQRIQFNEKQAENNIIKLNININQNKNIQQTMNENLQQKIKAKEMELRQVKAQINQVEINFDNKMLKSSKQLQSLQNNMNEFQTWKEDFIEDVQDKVQKMREQMSSIQSRMSFSIKNHDLQPQVHKMSKSRHRNSEFIMKRSFLQRNSKNINQNVTNELVQAKKSWNKSNNQQNSIHTQNVNIIMNEKLSFIQGELQRQKRIVDRGLFQRNQERALTESSKQNKKSEKTQLESKYMKKPQLMEQFRKQIIRTIKEMEGKMNESKVSKEAFDKTTKGLYQKIRFLQMLVVNKSDKQQVKNAFAFLQKKLKQLIIVVTNNEINEKDGMLTKQQAIKCLSCSHHVQKQSQKNQINHWKTLKGNQMNSSLQMRNDYRNLKTDEDKKELLRKNVTLINKSYRPESKSLAFSKKTIIENSIRE